jgi:hypothetical protein
MAYQQQTEGDMGFRGFASRINPIALEPGLLQEAFNCRMERGVVAARKGLEKLIGDEFPLDTLITTYAYTDTGNIDRILLVVNDGLYVFTPEQYNQAEIISVKVPFPAGRYMVPKTTLLIDGAVSSPLTTEAGYRIITAGEISPSYDVQGPFPYNGEQHFVFFRGRTDESKIAGTFSKPSGTNVAVTVTTASAHGYAVGDELSFWTSDTNADTLNDNYIVTSIPSSTTFTFQYTGAATTQHTNKACEVQAGKPPLYWDGVSASADIIPQTAPAFRGGAACSAPPADFGLMFQNRLIAAYKRNKIAVSDILDYRTFDLTLNNFTINTGLNDTLVGVLPWVQDQFLVFMQKSIYLCYVETSNFTVGAAPGANSTITVLTTEIGCSARRSIVTAGEYVFFLSNKGVNMLTPQLDLKLIGSTKTLSNPIDDWMRRVNLNAVSGACSAYVNNRLWMSVPIDGALQNDHMFVWNMLNEAWESIDTYATATEGETMGADELKVVQYRNLRELFVIRKFESFGAADQDNGGVYVSDQREDGDLVSTQANGTPIIPFYLPAYILDGVAAPVPVQSSLKTRQYTLGTLQEKFWSNVQVVAKSYQATDQIAVTIKTSNQDISQDNGVITFEDVTDKTYRDRIGLRGYAVEANLSLQNGQPEIRAITITGTVASRPMVSQA